MPKLSFPELAPDISARDLRAWLPAPQDVVDACEHMCVAGEPEGLRALLGELGAPLLDMLVTPLSARAALLSAKSGRTFFHHELRGRIAMPPELEPELSVWDQGTVPVWRDGVLTEPKYFSFFQDAPFPAFNPNYRRKWRPHELLHGAVKFFWRPDMTRFEMYIASRLNELLPIIHWYGLDEVFRPRCAAHEGKILYREYCAACEQAAKPYWETDPAWRQSQQARGIEFVENAWQHLHEEWNAIVAECETGKVHETPRPYLNASSDSIGYMRAHWNRVTAWSFGYWMELFHVSGVDYFSSLDSFLDHSAQMTQQLVHGDIEVQRSHFEAARTRRMLQDVGYRTLVAMEWLTEGSSPANRAEDALMPHLEHAATLCQEILHDPSRAAQAQECLQALFQAFTDVSDVFPDAIAISFPRLGYTHLEHSWVEESSCVRAALPQIIEGLHTGLPETMKELCKQPEHTELIEQFTCSNEFNQLGRLATRFQHWVDARELHNYHWGQWASFEAWIGEEPRRDEEAEWFASLPETFEELRSKPGQLRLHKTLRRRWFSSDFVEGLTGEPSDEVTSTIDSQREMAAIYMRDELRLIVLNAQIQNIFENIEKALPVEQWVPSVDASVLENLLGNGFVLWLPRPR